VNSFSDPIIGATAADVATHCIINILVGGLGDFIEQSYCTHYLSGLAIAALSGTNLNPSYLDRMGEIGRKTFDSYNLFALKL
jgi:hypothetical protein